MMCAATKNKRTDMRAVSSMTVAQVDNLLFRRLAVGGCGIRAPTADCQSAIQQRATLRYDSESLLREVLLRRNSQRDDAAGNFGIQPDANADWLALGLHILVNDFLPPLERLALRVNRHAHR